MRQAIELLKTGNVNDLIKLTHPQVVTEYGEAVIKEAYSGRYIPFFADFTAINEDEGTISRYLPDEYASNGMFYGEFFISPGGSEKEFVIAVAEWNNKPYVVGVYINTTVEEL